MANNIDNTGKKTFKHWDLLSIGLLFATTLIIFSSFIFSDKMMSSSDQLSGVGSKRFLSESLTRYRQMPTWYGSRLGGMPSIDASFGDVFYPISTVMRLFVSPYRLFGFTMILHVFLAGAFFFLMLRRSFKTGCLIAFAGALFYMLSPQFVSHISPGHDGKMFVIAWLPFVIWRLRSLLYLPTLRNACLMAIGIATMLLTGHIQMTYFTLMGLFLYWVTDVALAMVGKEDKKRIAFKAFYFWCGVFIALGIACVQLYPSYMFVRGAFSVRGVDRGFEFAASWSMNWAEFFSLWVHEFGNALDYYWGKNYFKLNTEYVGAVPLMLTVLAVVSKPKSVWRIFWAAVAALSVLYALGANTPFFSAAYHIIPGVKRFRAPSMIMFWLTFSAALMATFFIKDLLSKRFDIADEKLRKKWTFGLGFAMGVVTLTAAVFSSESAVASFAGSMMGDGNKSDIFKMNFSKNFVPNLWYWWLISTVTLCMLIAIIKGKIKAKYLVYVLLVLSVIDMVKVNNQFVNLTNRWQYFYRDDITLKELKSEFDKTPFRVFTLPRVFTTQNQEDVYGLEGVGGFHDNELVNYRAFRGEGDAHYLSDIAEIGANGQMRLGVAKILGNTRFLDLADVDYVLYGAGSGAIGKIKNPTNLGRLSYAPNFVTLPDDAIVNALVTNGYDYRTTVALSEEPELPFAPSKNDANTVNINKQERDSVDIAVDNNATDNQNDAQPIADKAVDDIVKKLKVEWKKYTPNMRVASVTMPDDGFLRISEVYYPGWRIKVNGTAVKYYRSDMTWMAVPLKAGNYEIVMEPKSLYLGDAAWVSLICTVFTVIILSYGYLRGAKKV